MDFDVEWATQLQRLFQCLQNEEIRVNASLRCPSRHDFVAIGKGREIPPSPYRFFLRSSA